MRTRSLGSRLWLAIRPVLGSLFSAFHSQDRSRPLAEALERRQLLSSLSFSGDDSANAWLLRVSPTDSTHLQVFNHSTPTGTPIYDGLRREVDELIINGNGGNDTLIVDFSGGVPLRTDVLSFSGGAGSDTLNDVQNLCPLELTFPNDLPVGSTITLAVSAGAADVRLWNNAARTGSPLGASTTWTVGTDTLLHTLYVEGLRATAADAVEFTLTVTPAGGPAQPATVPTATTAKANVKARTRLTFGFYGADSWLTFPNWGNQQIDRIASNVGSSHTFESTKWGTAYGWLIKTLDTNGDGRYDPTGYWTNKGTVYHSGVYVDPTGTSHNPDDPRSIRIFGYSWGGLSAVLLSQKIQRDSDFQGHNTIDILALIDPCPWGRGDFKGGVLGNVQTFWNRYRTAGGDIAIFGMIKPHGYRLASQAGNAADPNAQIDVNPTGTSKTTTVRYFDRQTGRWEDAYIDHFTIIRHVENDITALLTR